MAYVGLTNPIIAKRSVAEGGAVTYSEAFECGKAVGTNISAQYAEGSLYANNAQAEYEKVFKYADITLETSTLPVKAESVMFGHTVKDQSGTEDGPTTTITDKAGDLSNEVGIGIVREDVIDGEHVFVAMWMCRAKFAAAAEDYTTKGENIEFKTPSVTGRAYSDETGIWRERAVFGTESAAIDWVKSKANME